MNNYNERLDDVLSAVYLAGTENGLSSRLTDAEEIMHRKKAFINGNHASKEAKQAITSLIKELVEEVKPEKLKESDYILNMVLPHNPPSNTTRTNLYRKGYNDSLNQFEQNLLKELEEV